MAWVEGLQKYKTIEDYNSIVKELSGDLNDKEARITLTKFMKTNLGLTFEIISGVKLFPLQEIILKGLLYADNSLVVASRGAGKSLLISVWAIMECIFNPGIQFCLISTNFRASRRILESMEKIVNHKKAELLAQCFPTTSFRRSNDLYRWMLPNQAEIFALPLNEQIRGFRAQRLAIDEMVTVSKELQENIVRPFLAVKQNIREEMEYKEIEDELIASGVITENDRISFPKNKFAGFSSASYQFQYLYTLFQDYIDNVVQPPKEINPPKYFVTRFSYEAFEKGQIFDMTQINSAKNNGGENSESFQREYKGLFTKSGGGYFDAKKLFDCTIKLNDFPTVQLRGDKDTQYLMTIDPSYSASKTSDHFAIGVYMMIPQERRIILVNSYAVAGGDLKDHYLYLCYLLSHFNIEMICIDGSGTEFIHGFNESVLAKERHINLKFLDVNFNSDAYLEEISNAKNQFNKTSGRIVYGQNFTSQSIRVMNEHLSNQISAGKVWFASSLGANDQESKKYIDFQLPFTAKNKHDIEIGLAEFITDQDALIDMTKNQCALIEVKATATGSLQFDLPQNLRRENSVNKARRDSYTCLLMAAFAAKCYFDMLFTETEKPVYGFEPIIIY